MDVKTTAPIVYSVDANYPLCPDGFFDSTKGSHRAIVIREEDSFANVLVARPIFFDKYTVVVSKHSVPSEHPANSYTTYVVLRF